MTYREDGSATGFTFERARWTGPFGLHFSWPFLNPLGFATHETAVKILNWARSFAPPTLTVALDETQKNLGPFTRTVERQIVVSDGTQAEVFSAGLLANSIIRNGEARAAESFKAEWRVAGVRF
jgi:hypothetical protein